MSAASLVSYVIGKLKSDEAAPGDMSGSGGSPPTPQLTTVWRTKSIPYDIPDTSHPFRNEGSLLKLLRTKSMPLLGREGSSPQRLQLAPQQAHATARSQSPSPVRHPRNRVESIRNMSGHFSDASESTVASVNTPPPTPRSPSPTGLRSRSASDGHLWQRRKKQVRRHTDKVTVTLPSVKDLRGKFDEKPAASPTDKQPPANPAPVNDHALREGGTGDEREGRRVTRHYSMLRPHLKSPERRQPLRQAVTPDNVRKILEKFEISPQIEGEESEVFSRSDSQELRIKSCSEVTLKTSDLEVQQEDQTRRRTSLQGRQKMKNHRRSKSEPDPSAVLRHHAQTSPPSVRKLKLLFEREALAGGGNDFTKSAAPEPNTYLEQLKEKTPEPPQVRESRENTAGETQAEESSAADQQLLGVEDATGQMQHHKTPPIVEVLAAGTPSVRSLRQRFEEGSSAQSLLKIAEEEVASRPRRAIVHQLKTPFEESLRQKSRSVSPEKESRHSLTSFSSASVKNLTRQFEALSPEILHQEEQDSMGHEPMLPSSPPPTDPHRKLQMLPLDSVAREAQHDTKPADTLAVQVLVDSSSRRRSLMSSSESSSDDEERKEKSRRQEMERQRERKQAENEKERQRTEQEQKWLQKAKEKEEKERKTLEILEKEREAKRKLEEERRIREREEQERLEKKKEKEKLELEIRKREREERERKEREREEEERKEREKAQEEKKEREKLEREMKEKAEMERRERERMEREKAKEEEEKRKKREREEAERLRLLHEKQEEEKTKEEARRKRIELIRRLSGEEVPKAVGRDEARENDKKAGDKPSVSSSSTTTTTHQGEASSEPRVEQLIDQFTNLRDFDLEGEARRGDAHHKLDGGDLEDEDADGRRHSDVAALVNKFRKLNARRGSSSSSESDGEDGKPRSKSVKEEAPIPTIPARSSGPGKVRTLREDEMRFFESAGGGTEPFLRTQSLRVKKSEQSHFTQPRFGSLRGSKSNKSRVAVLSASSTTTAALPRNCRRLNSDELQFFTGEVTNIYRNRATKSRGRARKTDRVDGRPPRASRGGALPDTEEFFRIAGRAEQGGEPNGRPANSENESDSEPSVLRTGDDVITDSESDIYELDINLRSDADTEDPSDTEDRSDLDQTLSLFVHSIQGELLPPVATEGCGEAQTRCYVVFSPETHPWSSEDEDEDDTLESPLVSPTLTENVLTPILKENGISLAVHQQEGLLSDAPKAVVLTTPTGDTKTEQTSNRRSEGEDNTLHPPRQHYTTGKDANSSQRLDFPQHSGDTKENGDGIDFLGGTKADLRPSEELKGLVLTGLVTGETGEIGSREAGAHLLTPEKRDSSEKKMEKYEEDNVKKMEKKEMSVKVEKIM
ncbi:trichohyalin-like [Portunus trituberculatus]|uniref:trichohyalin-like n=1 Tax=Portunus trituberculatus TaxID=210409 RepID=UPI001E1D0FCC|nr:trichohyalin-like [Portunus trituberculatus]